jgi:CubicO group peptidase (beta-lactamase class C family)
MKHLTTILLILILFAGCLTDGSFKTKTITYVPVQLNDGWNINTDTFQILDMNIFNEVMNKVYSENDFLLIRSLVIAIKGELIIDAYPKTQADRTTPRQTWSVTKSFVSMLTGIAYDQGHINNVSDLVFDYIPEYLEYAYPQLKYLTIEQCLTMRSGINYNNDGWEEEELLAMVPKELTKYILQRPMKYLPGQVTDYKNSDPQLLVKVISNAVQMDFLEYAKINFFEKLGITNYYWSRNRDNTPYGGFGLFLTPRDLAKTGQMLLEKGVWKNQQIISEEWIDEAATYKTICNGFDYGYYFWIESNKNYYFAWGRSGQYIFVVPDKELVIVITSEQFTDKGLQTSIEQAPVLVDKIRESIK